MSMTYTDEDRALGYDQAPVESTETAYVPAYARGRRSQKKVKTWMILAPLGLLVLAGGAAMMMMTRPVEPAPLAEPAPVAPLVAPLTPAPNTAVVDNALITAEPIEATPAPQAAPAPVARRAAPLRRPAAAPAARVAPAPAPADASGLRPYTPSATTGASVSAPAPRIVTQPLPSTPAPAPAPVTPSIPTAPLT